MNRRHARLALAAALLATLTTGCTLFQPATVFVLRMELGFMGERPKNWDQVKRLGRRRAPAVGEVAPDFTLPALDDDRPITRSQYQADRPLVLIFGSYT